MNTEAATTVEAKPGELSATPAELTKATAFERIGPNLYRRGGQIVARVRVNGKPTWRTTGTGDVKLARQWLKRFKTEKFCLASGVELPGQSLLRQRVTVGQLMDDYLEAGCPTKKMQTKAASTLKREKQFITVCRAFFGPMPAAVVTLADCDKYRDWRQSGGYVSAETGKRVKMPRKWKRLRTIDMELQMLSNVFRLAVRRAVLKANPLAGRACYSVASEIRHCREVAPTPDGLHQIEYWLRGRGEQETADLACFLGYSGLRIGEALMLDWECVDWGEGLLHVTREKKGVFPWVPLSADLVGLLRQMQTRARSHLLFPSPFDPNAPRERTAFGNRLRKACKALGIGHVTPHGLRSYYVSRCRESGLTDAEVSMLIGDKSGPALIAAVYGSLAPAHLLAQARRVKLTAKNADNAAAQRSIKLIHTLTENDAQTGRATTGNGVSQHAAA